MALCAGDLMTAFNELCGPELKIAHLCCARKQVVVILGEMYIDGFPAVVLEYKTLQSLEPKIQNKDF